MQYDRKTPLVRLISGFGVLLLIVCAHASAQKRKSEHISANAMGTSTQLGRLVSVEVHINEYSTPADQAALLEAFAAKGSEGLTNAVDKMSAKGRLAITGTLGFDLNYIREFKMPDGGRRIRFVTDRPIRMGELWASTRSMDYALSMGEIIISPGKNKTKGVLMPAAKFRLNKEKEIEIETFQNAWDLTNIKVWK